MSQDKSDKDMKYEYKVLPCGSWDIGRAAEGMQVSSSSALSKEGRDYYQHYSYHFVYSYSLAVK